MEGISRSEVDRRVGPAEGVSDGIAEGIKDGTKDNVVVGLKMHVKQSLVQVFRVDKMYSERGCDLTVEMVSQMVPL